MKSQYSKVISLFITFIVAANIMNAQSLYPLTKNLFVKIEGKYPQGYQPKWRLIGSPQNQELTFEQYVATRGGAMQTKVPVGIVEYQGKTVLRFRALSACECVADLQLPNEKLVIGQNPIKIELSSFRKVQQKELDDPNASCQNMAVQTQGGWKGYAILSADEEGNLIMNLRLENYASPRYRNGALMYTWFGNNISISNLMTPDKAAETAIAHENKEKEEKKQAELYAKRQEKREYLDALYSQKLKTVKTRPANTTISVATYKGYILKKPIDLENLVGNSISTEEGVKEAYAKAKSAYYKLRAYDYGYNVKELEPHERDGKFAFQYCKVKSINQHAIDIATYALIGDTEKLIDIANSLNEMNLEGLVSRDDFNEILGYLKSKD